MESSALKEKIIENNYVPIILESLGCHHISKKSEWYQCGNPDGDRQNAITVYLNNNLTTINYTRNIGKKDSESNDIFDLIQFFKDCTFYQAVKFVCDCCDVDYYADGYDDLPESLKFTRLIEEFCKESDYYDEIKPVKPISEKILTYYKNVVNDFFLKDNISYNIQLLFEIGYDDESNRITIPIRDEIGTLVGVKGRLFVDDDKMTDEQRKVKYLYIEKCNRSKILYGLYLSEVYIKKYNVVYVVEAEKGVLQLWSMGIKNCVATGGKKITKYQIEMLSRLCSNIVFCYDKDVTRKELKEIADKFIDCIHIRALIDTGSILDEKESPTDNPQKFKILLKEHCEVIK